MGSSRGISNIKLIRNGQSSIVGSAESISNRKPMLDRIRFDENQRPTSVPSWAMLDRVVQEEFPEMNPDEFVVAEVDDSYDEGYRRDLGQMLKVLVDYKRIYGFKIDGFRPFTQQDLKVVNVRYVEELGQPAEEYAGIPPFGIFTDNETGRAADVDFDGKHYLVYDPGALPHRNDRNRAQLLYPNLEMLPSTRETIMAQLGKINGYRMNLANGIVEADSRFAAFSEKECQGLAELYEEDLESCGDTDAGMTGSHLDSVRGLTCDLVHEVGHLIIHDQNFGQENYDDIIEKMENLAPPTEYAKVTGDEKFAELLASVALGMPKPEFSNLLREFGLPQPPIGYVKFG